MHEPCTRHQFESAEDVCRNCGSDFCGECLVYALGADKPPYCLGCALAASGVRSGAGNPQVRTKREIKARHKEWRDHRASAQRMAPPVEISAFVGASAPSAGDGSDDSPMSWLDEHLDGSGERVPF
jgi:hypothetical protein